MSILSKVKSAAKKVISTAKNLLTGKNTASAGMAFPLLPGASISGGGQTIAPNMTVAPTKNDPGGPGVAYNGGAISYNSPALAAKQNAAAVKASSAPITIGGRSSTASSSSNRPSGSPTITNSTMSISPQMSVSSLRSSGGESNFSAQSSSNSGLSNSSLPSAPYSSNPGLTDISALYTGSPDYLYDPATGTVTLKEQPQAEEETKKKGWGDFFSMIPKKKNLYEDPEVRKQQAEVRRKQQEVNDYTSQLNSIVSKQQADLLNLREIGSKEGVTETVYGGQQATINREAAVRALPIQAALAGAQGNLELANDYLNQITKIRSEDIDNDYTYQSALYNFAYDRAEKEDQRKLKELDTQNSRAWEMAKLNLADQDAWAKLAISNGQSNLVPRIQSLNPNSPTFRNDLARVTGGIVSKGEGSGGSLSILDVARYNELYPDAGVSAGDSEATANSKVVASKSSGGQVKPVIEGLKQDGMNYKEVVDFIYSSETLKDKTSAVKAADAVYGITNHDITDQISKFIFSN